MTSPKLESPRLSGRGIDLGAEVADWCEENLVHGEGDVYGEPIVWEGWQRDILRRLYWHDEELRRVVRKALLVMPKGTAKSELIAAVLLAELCGPVAIAGTASNPEPARRKSPNIPAAAASYEQADRLFYACSLMAGHEDSGIRHLLDIGATQIRLKDGPGRLFKVAAEAGTQDGGLPTAFGADEIHEWRKTAVRRVHLVIGNSLAKRSAGLELNISTPDEADPDSLFGQMYASGVKVATGEVVDPSFLFIHYGAGPGHDLDDPEDLRTAIREATPAHWVDVESVARRYEIDRVPPHEFRRYNLAELVRPVAYWLPEGAFEALEVVPAPPDGTKVALGFDGSYSRDSTALWGCTLEGALFKLGVWETPKNAPKDWIVPRSEVDAAVDEAFERYDVVELACDPHRWTSEIEAWAERYGDRVVDFNTATPARMAPACARFYAAVVSGEGISHDGDAVLARHLSNAITKRHRDGDLIVKDYKGSPRKIDAAVAAVLAYDRAMSVHPKRSVYEERGLETV